MRSCVANNFPSYRKQWLLFFTKQINNKLDTKTHVYLHRRYMHLSGTPSRTYYLITTAVMVAQEGPRPGMAASLSSWFMGCTAAKGTKKLKSSNLSGNDCYMSPWELSFPSWTSTIPSAGSHMVLPPPLPSPMPSYRSFLSLRVLNLCL